MAISGYSQLLVGIDDNNPGRDYIHHHQKLAPPGQQFFWCIPIAGVHLFPVGYEGNNKGAPLAPRPTGAEAPLRLSRRKTKIHQQWVYTSQSAALEGQISGGGVYSLVPDYSH
jgi:hypothetical protein